MPIHGRMGFEKEPLKNVWFWAFQKYYLNGQLFRLSKQLN